MISNLRLQGLHNGTIKITSRILLQTIKYGNGVDKPNRRYNSNWGYMTGEDGIAREYSQSVNWYSKPVCYAELGLDHG